MTGYGPSWVSARTSRTLKRTRISATATPVMTMARTDGAALGLGVGAWHGVAAVGYVGACVTVAVVVLKFEFR